MTAKRVKKPVVIPDNTLKPVAKAIRRRALRDVSLPKKPNVDKTKVANAHAQIRANNRDRVNADQRERYSKVRDIYPLPTENIDWDRRLTCKTSLKKFCEHYLRPVFYLDWSDDQLIAIDRIEMVCSGGGQFALAMPRGGGKTALCRAGILWSTAYGHRQFAFFIGASEPKSKQALEFLKSQWYSNSKLRDDFPEIGYCIYKLENRQHLAKGQIYRGVPTHTIWTGNTIRYPTVCLPKEDAKPYLEYDPDFMVPVVYDNQEYYIPKSGGCTVRTSGIDGSIRGDAETHPILLSQPRPDLVLLDDIQKDQRADSPVLCEKLISMVDGAVQGLSGPDKQIAALMPCTVIRDGDVSDTYLSPEKKPDWNGHKCKMVQSWPLGITDFEITNTTPESQLWLQYDELRRLSLRQKGDISLATGLYKSNMEVMNKNFKVSWPMRFKKEGRLAELSAQQHAMNLRFTLGPSFLPEYQNIGRKPEGLGEMLITAEQVARKTLGFSRFELPTDIEHVVAHIDVQNEVLFYMVLGVSPDFNGIFTTYGTFPEIQYRHFTKDQTEAWSLLSSEFFKDYPQHQATSTRNNRGRIRAPLEAKIYHALGKCVDYLKSMTFTRKDQFKREFKIEKIGIDTRWGQASDVIKRFIRESGNYNLLIPYQGQFISPANRQIEEYEWRKGWLFEHQKHPHVKEPFWVYRPNPDGHFYMMADVSRGKDFLMRRLAAPPGTKGSISFFNAPPEDHDLMASHICDSEEPLEMTMKGRTKNQWKMKEPKVSDNDYLDCATGCMAIASYVGASVKTTEVKPVTIRRRLSAIRK